MSSGQPTASPSAFAGLLRTGPGVWVRNSIFSFEIPPAEAMANLDPLAWACVAVGGLVLVHSFLLHRTRLSTTRTLVEVSGLGSVLGGVFFLLGRSHPDRASHAYFINLGLCVFAYSVAKTPDNIIFMLGYRHAVKSVSRGSWLAIIGLTIALRYLPLVLGLTVFPFFTDGNSSDFYWYLYYPALLVTTAAGVVSNVFFTYEFVLVLYRVNVRRSVRVPRVWQVFMAKCVLHCVSSTIPTVIAPVRNIPLPESIMVVLVVVSASIHLLFNCELDGLMLFALKRSASVVRAVDREVDFSGRKKIVGLVDHLRGSLRNEDH